MFRQHLHQPANQIVMPLAQGQHQTQELVLGSTVVHLRQAELLTQILNRLPHTRFHTLLKYRPSGECTCITHNPSWYFMVWDKDGENRSGQHMLLQVLEGLFTAIGPDKCNIFPVKVGQRSSDISIVPYEMPIVVTQP